MIEPIKPENVKHGEAGVQQINEKLTEVIRALCQVSREVGMLGLAVVEIDDRKVAAQEKAEEVQAG